MPEQADYNLTPHEARLLRLLMEGHSYKTGAAAMSVSFKTISFHMKNVYQKLHVHSKSEALAKALRTNLIGESNSYQYWWGQRHPVRLTLLKVEGSLEGSSDPGDPDQPL